MQSRQADCLHVLPQKSLLCPCCNTSTSVTIVKLVLLKMLYFNSTNGYSMCKSNVRSASSFEKIDFDAIKAEESKEGVEIAESVVKEELVDKAIYDIVSQYISDDAIKQNVLRIITRQTEYIDWANKEATISDLRRKIKRSLSLQSISSDVATQSARNMVSQLVNLYVKK